MNNIAIILVKPQMGENIGSTARVMKNFGFSDLRIINPRGGWPNAKAHEMSAHADDIIESAKIYENMDDAVADFNTLFATAANIRDMVKPVISPETAANEIKKISKNKKSKIGILFGKESSGLDNDSISRCNYMVSIPVSNKYDSLNIAQAACVICYEIFKHLEDNSQKYNSDKLPLPEISKDILKSEMATRHDIEKMLDFIEVELDRANFFQVAEKKPAMMINIRNIFSRHHYTGQEIRTLRGIFNALKKN